MKLFIFFYFFSIFNCLHTLDPLLNYFDNLIQELDLNLNFNDHFNKFLIPSYSEILKEIVPIHKLQTNSPEKPQNERILNTELFCNFGAQINVTKLNYLCSNKSVSREYYNETMQNYTAGANNTPPCYILFTNEKECYCPKDFYGINCQYENSIDCTMDYRKPNSCPTFNNEFYVSDYGGDSPCNFVKKNDLTIVSVLVKCANKYPNILMESSYFNYDFLDLDKTNLPKFNYYLDSENLVSSYYFQVNPIISFVNWNSLTDTKIIQDGNLFLFELNGQIPHNVFLNFSDISDKYKISGRYYVEFNLGISKDKYAQEKKKFFQISFDEANYQEPNIEDYLNWELIVLIVVVCLVIAILLVFGIIYMIRNKNKKVIEENNNLILQDNLQ